MSNPRVTQKNEPDLGISQEKWASTSKQFRKKNEIPLI